MPRTPRVTIPKDVWVEFDLVFDNDPFSGDGKLGEELATRVSGVMNVNRNRLMYDFDKGKLTFRVHYDRPMYAERGAMRAMSLRNVEAFVAQSLPKAKREKIAGGSTILDTLRDTCE